MGVGDRFVSERRPNSDTPHPLTYVRHDMGVYADLTEPPRKPGSPPGQRRPRRSRSLSYREREYLRLMRRVWSAVRILDLPPQVAETTGLLLREYERVGGFRGAYRKEHVLLVLTYMAVQLHEIPVTRKELEELFGLRHMKEHEFKRLYIAVTRRLKRSKLAMEILSKRDRVALTARFIERFAGALRVPRGAVVVARRLLDAVDDPNSVRTIPLALTLLFLGSLSLGEYMYKKVVTRVAGVHSGTITYHQYKLFGGRVVVVKV